MFDPVVEIFRVGKGAEFSMVYMEGVLGKCNLWGKIRPIVEFTVIPGFKVARTVIHAGTSLSQWLEKCRRKSSIEAGVLIRELMLLFDRKEENLVKEWRSHG